MRDRDRQAAIEHVRARLREVGNLVFHPKQYPRPNEIARIFQQHSFAQTTAAEIASGIASEAAVKRFIFSRRAFVFAFFLVSISALISSAAFLSAGDCFRKSGIDNSGSSFPRFCTFDCFLRLAMITPFWLVHAGSKHNAACCQTTPAN